MLSRADRARLRESEAKLRSLVSALEGTRCSGDVLHDELMAIKSEQNDNANVQLARVRHRRVMQDGARQFYVSSGEHARPAVDGALERIFE